MLRTGLQISSLLLGLVLLGTPGPASAEEDAARAEAVKRTIAVLTGSGAAEERLAAAKVLARTDPLTLPVGRALATASLQDDLRFRDVVTAAATTRPQAYVDLCLALIRKGGARNLGAAFRLAYCLGPKGERLTVHLVKVLYRVPVGGTFEGRTLHDLATSAISEVEPPADVHDVLRLITWATRPESPRADALQYLLDWEFRGDGAKRIVELIASRWGKVHDKDIDLVLYTYVGRLPPHPAILPHLLSGLRSKTDFAVRACMKNVVKQYSANTEVVRAVEHVLTEGRARTRDDAVMALLQLAGDIRDVRLEQLARHVDPRVRLAGGYRLAIRAVETRPRESKRTLRVLTNSAEPPGVRLVGAFGLWLRSDATEDTLVNAMSAAMASGGDQTEVGDRGAEMAVALAALYPRLGRRTLRALRKLAASASASEELRMGARSVLESLASDK